MSELNRIRKMKVEMAAPSEAIPPHEGGNDSPKDRDDAVRLLMEYRYLCYVPFEGMMLDPVYCAHDEAAAGILAVIGKLSHTPTNPGWPDEQYKYAYAGTSHSNIYERSGGRAAMCVASVNAFMDDSDSTNIDRLGHRRWCLNPRMGKVGFASFKGFSAMWSMDSSRQEVPDFDYVACPSPGLFPSTHFDTRHAWSLTLNEAKYARPTEKGVKVTVMPVQVQIAQNKIAPNGKSDGV